MRYKKIKYSVENWVKDEEVRDALYKAGIDVYIIPKKRKLSRMM
jgi:hypothetical protein